MHLHANGSDTTKHTETHTIPIDATKPITTVVNTILTTTPPNT